MQQLYLMKLWIWVSTPNNRKCGTSVSLSVSFFSCGVGGGQVCRMGSVYYWCRRESWENNFSLFPKSSANMKHNKKKLISIKCICEKEELRDLRKGRVQGGEVWKEERGRRTALRIKHCELSCLHLELLVNNFTSALFLFSKPTDWQFCSNPNKVIYLKVLLSRKSRKWSQIVFSTPTINFCYLYQHGSDVYAFFFFSCLHYVKKKSVFYQALYFLKNIVI